MLYSRQMTAKKVIIEILLSSATGRNRLQGVFDFLRSRCDWDVRLPQTRDEFVQALAEPVDGVITSRVYSPALLRRLEKMKTPVVFMDVDRRDRKAFRAIDVTVANDNGGIGLAAGAYYARLGRFRAYGYVPSPLDLPWSLRRGEGFAAALRRHGHDVQAYAPGEGTLAEWIRRLPKPAAVFCACDVLSRATIEACRSARVKVPDQVAILGVDNDELICQITRPELSSIRPDTVGEGFEAAKALHAIMCGKARPGRHTILMKHLGVVERISTHPPPPAAHLVHAALEFIAQNAVKGATPVDVARHVGCSRRLLELRFSEFHTESIQSALVRTRLAAVRRELERSDRKFILIAKECGFSSAAVLKNLFRKTYGMSMREFRRSHSAEAPQ